MKGAIAMEKEEKVIQMDDPFTVEEIEANHQRALEILGGSKDADGFIGACIESVYMAAFVLGAMRATEAINGSKALLNKAIVLTIEPYEVK